LEVKDGLTNSSASGESESQGQEEFFKASQEVDEPQLVLKATSTLCAKQLRLVQWNSEILSKVLKDVIASREISGVKPDPLASIQMLEKEQLQCDLLVLEEVQDVIVLPKFDGKATKNQKEEDNDNLTNAVKEQLLNYVHTLAAMYYANPFHNFEHASHVRHQRRAVQT